MNTNPLVSVLISNYNYARFLPQCLDSVLAQTYHNIEVVVVDDGSTDDSRAVLERYAPKVRTVFQANGGQAAAMNRGVAESSGDVICFLDSDDGWEPEKVERVVEIFSSDPSIGWVRHKARMVDEQMQALGSVAPLFSGSGKVPPDPDLFLERVINSQPACLSISRAVAAKAFPFVVTPDLAFDADDAVMFANVFAVGLNGYSIDEVLGFYRRHSGERFGGHDLPRLLRREAAVTAALPHAFNRQNVPSAAYKLKTIVATLEGAGIMAAERRRALVGGLRAAARLYRRPKLMLRQTAALAFAFSAPELWIRKLARAQQWPKIEAQ